MADMRLRDISIERKLTFIIIVAIASALGPASALIIYRQAQHARQQMIEDLDTLAGIVGRNSTAALSFRDEADAADVLKALEAKPTILAAGLFLPDQSLLAEYLGRTLAPDFRLPRPEADGYRISEDHVAMFQAVHQNEETIGVVLLLADLRPLNATIQRQILGAMLTILAAIAFGALLATRLQHTIVARIKRLVGLAQEIALGGLPGRVSVESADELGELQNSYNQIVDTAKDIVTQAQTLARGDYSITIKPRSDRDALGHALVKMTQALKTYHEQLENARKDLERKAHELELASKYKSEFLANVSHELRTPLNSLLILSKLLQENREGTLTVKQREFVDTITRSGGELLALINDILDLSKVEAGKMEFTMEPVAVKEVCSDLERVFQPTAEQRGLAFAVRMDPATPPTLITDPHRLGQILRNLLGNAFKFTKTGGVHLDIAPLAGDGPMGFVTFAVRDSGIGIPQHKLHLLFNAFQQADGATSREYGGTGLGLSISKELAIRLGGDIEVASEEGRGSTFTLRLPVEAAARDTASAATPASTSAARVKDTIARSVADGEMMRLPSSPRRSVDDTRRAPIGDAGLRGRKVLVVDDDMRTAFSLSSAFDAQGIETILAPDGRAALMELAEHPDVAWVLMDAVTPGADGVEVMQRLRSDMAWRRLPLIAYSDHAEAGFPDRCRAAGANEYLPKPLEIDKLLAVMRRTLKD